MTDSKFLRCLALESTTNCHERNLLAKTAGTGDTASRGLTTIVAPESQFRTYPTDHAELSFDSGYSLLCGLSRETSLSCCRSEQGVHLPSTVSCAEAESALALSCVCCVP
ncbi:hypothetical protein F511_36419 [Dorcoceras hygrometricum]|uniref:Uncharacterized protein n=1 Tax=Dorcoceras hygrometricum TaxID=472368 RepID=A0A2Z7D453_9LAMI|nr:hypothetical protein F511_36419 [Dorcoceras hygrometricum]